MRWVRVTAFIHIFCANKQTIRIFSILMTMIGKRNARILKTKERWKKKYIYEIQENHKNGIHKSHRNKVEAERSMKRQNGIDAINLKQNIRTCGQRFCMSLWHTSFWLGFFTQKTHSVTISPTHFRYLSLYLTFIHFLILSFFLSLIHFLILSPCLSLSICLFVKATHLFYGTYVVFTHHNDNSKCRWVTVEHTWILVFHSHFDFYFIFFFLLFSPFGM